jgi:uncharacterized RDD family membrane protein YckC
MANAQGEMKYAGFWRRFVAYVIDAAIFYVPFLILQFVLLKVLTITTGYDYSNLSFFSATPSIENKSEATINNIVFVIQSAVYIYIYKFFLLSTWQATPGKRIMNIYVVDTNGNRLTDNKAILRTALPLMLTGFFVIYGGYKGVEVQNDISDVNKDIISLVKEFTPKTYEKYVVSGMEEDDFIITITYPIYVAASEEDEKFDSQQYIDSLEFEENDYSRLQIDLIETTFEELKDLNSEDKKLMKQASESYGINSLYAFVNVMILFVMYLVIFCLWYVMAAFSKQKTAFHDIVAKTRVVEGRP